MFNNNRYFCTSDAIRLSPFYFMKAASTYTFRVQHQQDLYRPVIRFFAGITTLSINTLFLGKRYIYGKKRCSKHALWAGFYGMSKLTFQPVPDGKIATKAY